MHPYLEKIIDNISYRTFTEDIEEEELVWHRDEEDREVVALHPTDWKIQLDNELPRTITTVFIPKGVYHRAIKGTGDLKVKIKKYYDYS
jgi:hypothetical protein